MKHVRTLFRVISSEGVTAALNRTLDGLAERQRLRRFEPISAAELQRTNRFTKPPVINLSVLPPHPNRGGSQLQMLDRLREEELMRSVALLYPLANAWRLEVSSGGRRWILDSPKFSSPPPSLLDEHLLEAVNWARKILGTNALHMESLAGLPLDRIPALAEDGPIIVAVHDFTGYCRRPHLMEEPHSVFCNYSSDPARCRSCLGHDWQLPPDAAEVHRHHARQALMAADHIIFPSEFLKAQYSKLFTDLDFETRSLVIEPATELQTKNGIHRPHPPHVAFVGGIKGHKGGALVVKTALLLRERHAGLRLTSYGDGEPELIRRLKSTARVRVHGYYRSGKLPRLLVRDEVDVAILPSIWPESYGLVVDESLRAGVPVVAFDLGAIGPRLKRLGVGRVIPVTTGAEGLATTAAQLLNAKVSGIEDAVVKMLPTPRKVAEQILGLYRELEK